MYFVLCLYTVFWVQNANKMQLNAFFCGGFFRMFRPIRKLKKDIDTFCILILTLGSILNP